MDERTVITIGREFGSGGHEIGMKLAERLGIKCYDKELLELAAKESGLCEDLFASQDEKPTNSFLYSLVMDTYSLGYTSSYMDMPKFFWHSLIPLRNWLKENPVLLSDAVLTMLWKITHLQSAYGLRPIWMSVSSVLKSSMI